MGVIVGTLFYQSTYDPSNVFSIAFQSMFYSVISAMVLLRKQFPDRSMLYKHQVSSHSRSTSAHLLAGNVKFISLTQVFPHDDPH